MPQVTQRDECRRWMEARRVSPAIIDRVMRMNDFAEPGRILRGIHYQSVRDRRFNFERNFAPIGCVFRKHGRPFVEQIDRRYIVHDGRRRYVTHAGIVEAALRLKETCQPV